MSIFHPVIKIIIIIYIIISTNTFLQKKKKKMIVILSVKRYVNITINYLCIKYNNIT